MAKKKAGALDWYTIRYKDIYTIIFIIVLLVAIAIGGFIYWKYFGNMQARADRAIAKAESLLVELDTPSLPLGYKKPVQQAKGTLLVAQNDFKLKKYKEALQTSTDLVDILSALRDKINITMTGGHTATLKDVEGTVEVKSKGQHLFIPARKNQPLGNDDIVKTGPDGYARIKYYTGLYTTVEPDTLMVIQISKNEQGGDNFGLNIEKGKAILDVPDTVSPIDKSSIRTPDAKVDSKPDSIVEVSHGSEVGTQVSAVRGLPSVEAIATGESITLEEGHLAPITRSGLGAIRTLIAPPRVLRPKDGETLRVAHPENQKFRLEWSDSSNTVRLQISAKPLFSKLLHPEMQVRRNFVDMRGLPAGIYYWRIRAKGAEESTHWSKTHKFRIQRIYERPIIKRNLKLQVETTLIGDGAIIQGKTDPGVFVSVNDLEIPVNANGTFSKIHLFRTTGTELVVVRAFDEEGNEKVWQKRFSSSVY